MSWKHSQTQSVQDKTIRFLTVIVWLLITGSLIDIGLYTYFINFHDRPSVTWSNPSFPTTTPVVKAGDPIEFTVKRCSSDRYIARVSREIVDGIAYIIPQSQVIFEKGCVVENRIIPDVTKDIPAGTYRIRSAIEIDERWLWFSRIDKYETQTETFTIITPRIDPEAAVTP